MYATDNKSVFDMPTLPAIHHNTDHCKQYITTLHPKTYSSSLLQCDVLNLFYVSDISSVIFISVHIFFVVVNRYIYIYIYIKHSRSDSSLLPSRFENVIKTCWNINASKHPNFSIIRQSVEEFRNGKAADNAAYYEPGGLDDETFYNNT